jgi:hypothetical protein
MFMHRSYALIATVILAASLAFADNDPPQKSNPAQNDKPAQSSAKAQPKSLPMTNETRMLVIRSLNAEFVFVRKPFPMGQKGLVLKDGAVTPDDQQLQMLFAEYGMAAKPGDRAKITDVVIKPDRIHVEINGGPRKKSKWYQHIEVGGMGGSAPVAPDRSDPAAKGSYVDLLFDKYVPEMTGNDVRELLAPVLDFHAHSAAEAYIDTVPPKVKEAIKNHEVLVGMNREMVTYAKGRPDQKIREKDPSGSDYEEWIYGQPPKEVAFVRFTGDEVTRLELMKVDGSKVVRTDKEVDVSPVQVKVVQQKKEENPVDQGPGKKPSLKRPGEQ